MVVLALQNEGLLRPSAYSFRIVLASRIATSRIALDAGNCTLNQYDTSVFRGADDA